MNNSDIRIVEPFPLVDLPRLWEWMTAWKHQVFDDNGPQTEEEFVDLYMQRLKGGDRTFAVYRGAAIGGFVSVSAPDAAGVAEAHCVFRREFFGHKTTVPALSKIFEGVFQDGGVRKLATIVFSDNHAVLSLAKALGFQIEGTLREMKIRNGKPVDMKALGMLREELNLCLGEQSQALELAS